MNGEKSLKMGSLDSYIRIILIDKTIMIKELAKTNQNLRLILATVVLGMILNAPSVKRIKICTPLTNLEKYLHEVGHDALDAVDNLRWL